MDDGHPILDHRLLRRQAFLVDDRDGAAVLRGEMLEPVEAETGQPVPVGHRQMGDPLLLNALPQRQEHLALEIQAVPDFRQPLVHGHARTRAIRFHRGNRTFQVVPLPPTGHPAADRGQALRGNVAPAREPPCVRLGVIPPPGRGLAGRERAVARHGSQRVRRTPHADTELRDAVNPVHAQHGAMQHNSIQN